MTRRAATSTRSGSDGATVVQAVTVIMGVVTGQVQIALGGVDPMAVYRYFTDQEALFDGIAETLFTELDVDTLPWQGNWRDLAEQYTRRMRDTLLSHLATA